MTILLSFLFMSMFVYVNTLYYSMVLLAIVVTLLYLLVANLMLHTLTMIMICIVYIGAMMILIGYICAICPNLILSPTSQTQSFYMVFLLTSFLLFPINFSPIFNQTFIPMVTYFYSYSGVVVFISLILMLFITLLMVTSQYMTPKGPFRSVSI
uniref:NADH dehydrogenase subunit 6 n=1 Tax=Brachionus fernandoi TaxID=2498032 RepID=A0A8K1MGR3_9BILA|nr:NADH dehydrogenase subunit 6 [Brachionus fernandoi]